MKKRLLTALLPILAMALTAQTVDIKRYVKAGGTGRGTSWAEATGSIQSAVNDCKTAGSGTVYVAAGTYNELVSLPYHTKDITLLGSFPADGGDQQDYKNTPTIVDGMNQMACIALHGTKNIRIDGFVCSNGGQGKASYNPSLSLNLVANGISALNSGVIITHCTVENCNGLGIGVDCTISGQGRVEKCVVRGCGEGLALKNASGTSCEVYDNKKNGVYIYGHTLSSCRVYGNKGVGIYVDHATVKNCEVFNNTNINPDGKILGDGKGGGLKLSNYCTVSNCLVYNNSATIGGGAYADYGEPTIKNSTFVNNKASKGSGGIHAVSTNHTLTGLVLWNNKTGNTPNQFMFDSPEKSSLTNSAIEGGGELPETDAAKGIINLSSQNKADGQRSPCFKNVTPYVGASSSAETIAKIQAQQFILTEGSACRGLGGLESERTMTPKPASIAKTDGGEVDESGMRASESRSSTVKAVDNNSTKIYDVVEQMPSFPGGVAALKDFIGQNLKYPLAAEENGIEGRVIMTVVVESDGSLNDFRVVKSVDPLLDAEAVRVLKAMPKWIPGRQNGSPVRVKYTIPITFRL